MFSATKSRWWAVPTQRTAMHSLLKRSLRRRKSYHERTRWIALEGEEQVRTDGIGSGCPDFPPDFPSVAALRPRAVHGRCTNSFRGYFVCRAFPSRISHKSRGPAEVTVQNYLGKAQFPSIIDLFGICLAGTRARWHFCPYT